MNQEGLTPQQQADFEDAHVHAIVANEAFDERIHAARELARLRSGRHEADFTAADKKFGLYYLAAATSMPPIATFETAKPIEPFASETVWQAMTREQKAKAANLREAIGSGPLNQYGVTQDSLRVVMTETDGTKKFTLVHTGNGVDIGDSNKPYDEARAYSAVMSSKNDELLQVKVNGELYDTRRGMTDPVYDAKVADARARGVALPDSKELAAETRDVWTWTMLTGEPLPAGGYVQFRDVDVGRVDQRVCHPDSDDRVVRFCPAVVIE